MKKLLRRFLDWCFEPILIELREIRLELTAIRAEMQIEQSRKVRSSIFGNLRGLQTLKPLQPLGEGSSIFTSQDDKQ